MSDQRRHRWKQPQLRGGGRDKCLKCGCLKTNLRNQENNRFELRYQMPGSEERTRLAPLCILHPASGNC